MLIDSHCHIHDSDYPIDAKEAIHHAQKVGVEQLICIGTDADNSRQAINFANNNDDVFASVGVHPCCCESGLGNIAEILAEANTKVVAIGEIGLDYHYGKNQRDLQISLLKQQLELAIKYDMPIVFHVREAFDDFWPIIDDFIAKGTKFRGVIHSFTDSPDNAAEAIRRGFYIGVNGFSTFIKDEAMKKMYASLPLEKILLETDAPYLTPVPFRGKVNEPAFVRNIANFHASIRQISVGQVEKATTANVHKLFNF
jgi:TatD DNase family protein